uniref:Membrane protein UL56 n=1 Tax=Panagrellus redivivus TaxID=6233 RepID=A0A7E4UPS9_PANRE
MHPPPAPYILPLGDEAKPQRSLSTDSSYLSGSTVVDRRPAIRRTLILLAFVVILMLFLAFLIVFLWLATTKRL